MHCLTMRIPRTSVLGNALLTSTLHGLPRIITSKSIVVRVAWSLLLVVVLGLFGAHLADLTKKFLQEGLNTDTDLYGIEFEFPDIFICHKIPFSQSYTVQAHKNKDPRFQKLIRLLNSSSDLYNDMKKKFEAETNKEIKEPMSPTHIFWETVSWAELVDVIGHHASQTFPRIQIGERSVSVSKHVSLVSNYIYHYCFVVSVSQESLQFMNERVELTLFTDDDEDPFYKRMMRDLEVNFDFRFGLRIYFGPKGSSPNFESEFVHIRPGYSYDIRLEMLKYQKQNISRKPCYNDEVKFIDTFDYKKERQLNFMYKSCIQEKIQLEFSNKCGCYDTWLTDGLVTKSITDAYLPCFNTSDLDFTYINLILYDRFSCLNSFDSKSTSKYYEYCEKQLPCNKVVYFPKWTFMKWPADDEKQNTFKTLFVLPLESMNDSKAVPGWRSMVNSDKEIQMKIFESTVAHIRIRPQEFFSTVVEERLSYPWINYFSDIGGILGLYVGASLLTVFEVVEIIHNFARTIISQKIEQCKQNKKKQHEDNHKRDDHEKSNGHMNPSFWI